MSLSVKDKLFQEQVLENWNLYQTYPDIYRVWSEFRSNTVPEDTEIVLWYGRPSPVSVRLNAKPGTLAWRIMHYEADLPVYDENIAIDGDVVVRGIPFIPMPADADEEGEDEDGLDEDCTAELVLLPLIQYDPLIHFTKKARFKAEITNLLRCKGSPYIVQLLGRTAANQLVFPKYELDAKKFALHNSHTFTIDFVKQMLLSLIDGLAYLHSKDIIHCDLTARNLLISGDFANGNPEIIIIDLQCFAASYSAAPELKIVNGRWDLSLFSFKSDIYALGVCLREFILPGHHRSPMMGYDVPAPFKEIYEACMRRSPELRPGLDELRRMALDISS
ncbi:kinase-like domain-containing protein [Mycena filopes]|nr:kinase-like domain-containing protein [Mycena filopes]